MKLNPALRDFWKTKARIKVLYGGRASSKTQDAGGMAIHLARNYKIKFLCTRQFQNKITESVYTVLKDKIAEAGYTDDFTITNNRIICNATGSEFIFYGLWKNIDEIKSLEGVDICWLEEAQSITKEQWEILEPTIRKQGSEFWIIFNPRLRTDFVYKNFIINKQHNSIVRKINYIENPFLSETMKELIENKKEDTEEFNHTYLGEPRNEADNSLFNYTELETAMDNIYDAQLEEGVKVFGLDVARFGNDSTVLAIRSGLTIRNLQIRDKYSTSETASWIAGLSNQEETDAVVVDTIGVGGGVYDQLSGVNIFCIEGNVGMKADDNRYFNKRAEMYFKLKEALKTGLKLPRDEELMEELVATTYTFTEKGQTKIVPKDKIKEELGRSPDKADAVALTFFTTIAPKNMFQDDWTGGY